jgi:hypothetical protein
MRAMRAGESGSGEVEGRSAACRESERSTAGSYSAGVFSALLFAALISGCAWTEPEPAQTLSIDVTDPQGAAVPRAFCRAANDRGVWPFVAPGTVTVPRSSIPLDITCEYDTRVGFVRALPQAQVWSPVSLATVGGVHQAMDPLRYPATGYPESIEVVLGQTLSVQMDATPARRAPR